MIILKSLLLDISFNAVLVSINLSSLLLNLSLLFIRSTSSSILLSIVLLGSIVYIWFNDIIVESVTGSHTTLAQRNLLVGFVLFILSEVVIFSSIFFSYYYNVLIRSIFVGGSWIRGGIKYFTYEGISILNVLILFFSGACVTASLDMILKRKYCLFYLGLSIVLGVIFVFIQYIEFSTAKFTISDSFYGALFFCLTSLLAILMFIGILFLLIAFIRLYSYLGANLNLICASINLLLLDILFIFIYIFVYCYN